MATITNSTIEEIRKRHAEQQAQLDAELQQAIASALGKTTTELIKSLDKASKAFQEIPEDCRKDVLAKPEMVELLTSLGLEVKGTKHARTPAVEVSEADLLAFLAEPKMAKDIIAKWGMANVTLTKRLDKLVKEGKVKDTTPEAKRGKLWQKT